VADEHYAGAGQPSHCVNDVRRALTRLELTEITDPERVADRRRERLEWGEESIGHDAHLWHGATVERTGNERGRRHGDAAACAHPPPHDEASCTCEVALVQVP